MKVCFNEATTMKNSTLKLDLEFCEKYGYDFIEIRIDKLKEYLETNTINDLKDFFKKSKLKPYSFNALEFINFRDKDSFSEIIKDLDFCINIGLEIDCKKIVVVPTFDILPYTKNEIEKETVKILRLMSDIGKPYGMNFAFEFVGYPNCSVNTFEHAYHIVTETNRDNVGIVLDCFHFHAMNSKWEALEKMDIKKLFVFHLDDSEDLPVGYLRDNNRLWPMDGVIDLQRIFNILKSKGYDEMTSIELFRPEYWQLDTENCIKIAYEKTVSTINKFL